MTYERAAAASLVPSGGPLGSESSLASSDLPAGRRPAGEETDSDGSGDTEGPEMSDTSDHEPDQVGSLAPS